MLDLKKNASMIFCQSQSYGHIFKSSTRVAVNRMLQQTCQGVRGVWLQGREQDPFLRPLNLADLKKKYPGGQQVV